MFYVFDLINGYIYLETTDEEEAKKCCDENNNSAICREDATIIYDNYKK